MADVRTGQVFIRNYDQGVIETLGSYIGKPDDPTLEEALGHDKNFYFLDMPSCKPTKVPVIFNNPEMVKVKKIYPCFLVVRTDIEPALNRWHSVGQLQYRVPAEGSSVEVVEGVSGYDKMEQMVQAWPYDITYTITCMARWEHEAIPMLKKMLRVYKPYSKIKLVDSLGGERTYTAYSESPSDVSDILDVADRLKGYVITLRVEGELDLSDPSTFETVNSITRNVNPKGE